MLLPDLDINQKVERIHFCWKSRLQLVVTDVWSWADSWKQITSSIQGKETVNMPRLLAIICHIVLRDSVIFQQGNWNCCSCTALFFSLKVV